tara:strand:- start:214 stop:369 length:156 start_codon:yes stop_codon:yes gene_type:complete
MPKGSLDKNELLSHIYILKHQLDEEKISSGEKWKGHQYLSKVLDKIGEYRY